MCHDGESGLDNALTGIYDVVILDVMLPKMDGFSVLRQLRASGSAVPVLMLTARSELSDRVSGLDQGADYYLTKPFEPKELMACVRPWPPPAGAAEHRSDPVRRPDAGKELLHPLVRGAQRASEPPGV